MFKNVQKCNGVHETHLCHGLVLLRVSCCILAHSEQHRTTNAVIDRKCADISRQCCMAKEVLCYQVLFLIVLYFYMSAQHIMFRTQHKMAYVNFDCMRVDISVGLSLVLWCK